MFGVDDAPAGTESSGLTTRAIGISGVTYCGPINSLPSENMTEANSNLVLMGQAIFSFGGRSAQYPGQLGSDEVYRYDLLMSTWNRILPNLNHRRFYSNAIRLSDSEVLISGEKQCRYICPLFSY